MKLDKKSIKLLPPIRISCGNQFTLAVTDSGDLYAWGDNRNNKLGLNSNPESMWRPTKVESENIKGIVNQVSCGSEFSMCIVNIPGDSTTEAGVLLGWGVNTNGQIGIFNEAQIQTEVSVPTQIQIPEKVSRVSCGNDFTGCITEKGRVYTWGRGNYGNLGHGTTDSLSKPLLVQSLSDQNIISISCGFKHMAAITSNFKLYSWGNGGHGRLGHGDTTGTSTPKLIEALASENVMQVSCGDTHTGAISTLGVVYCWGSGSYGKLGHGHESDTYLPSVITTFDGKRMYMIACGFRHNLAISIQGEIFSWGAGTYGVTGLFDIKDIRLMLVPMKIQFFDGKRVTQIAVGAWHSLAITSVGEVWTWGYHGHGRLGLGREIKTDQAFPKLIPSNYIYGVTGGLKIIERITQIITNNVKIPKILQTRSSTFNNKKEKPNEEEEEEEANSIDLMLSRLETGFHITSFKEIMMIIKNEPKNCSIEEIRKNEILILQKFSQVFIILKDCKLLEENCSALISEYENRILQRSYELKLPQRDYLKVLIPSYIAAKLPEFEKIIWIFQQQPCYISRLVLTIKQRGTKDLPLLIRIIRIIFSNLQSDKSRESLLYLALCKEVISKEIGSALKLDDLFENSLCLSAQFLITFFSREYGSELYNRILSKPVIETINMMEAIGPDRFSIDPIDIASKAKRKSSGTIETILQDEKVKSIFEENITFVMRCVGLYLENFKVFPGTIPYSIKLLLKHAYSQMTTRRWLKEAGENEIKIKIDLALLRLLVIQMIVPVITTPETEDLTKRQLSQKEREVTTLIGYIIKKIAEKSLFVGNHFSVLNSFIISSYEDLQSSLENCLEIEDSSAVDLLVAIFVSNFTDEPTTIQFPVNDLVTTILFFIKYRKSTELFTGRDIVFKLLEKVGEIGSEVPNSLDNYKVNLKMSNNFLYDSEDIAVCSACGVLMPRKLAIIEDSKENIIKILKIDEDDFVDPIEKVFKKIPTFYAHNLEEISENLKKISEVFINVFFI